jgi:hypothetical protein
MRALTAVFAAFLALCAGPASAAIRITSSNYQDGVTVVTGQTAPNRTVTMDGRFTTKSDSGGHFKFRLEYKPATCMASIVSGEDAYSALIVGCLLGEAADRRKPRAPAR